MQNLVREKPVRVLLTLKSTDTPLHLSKLARQAGLTYVHLVHLVPAMEAQGWIKTNKTGKKRMVVLTEKGLEIAQLLEELKRRIEPEAKPPAAP